MSDLIGLAKKIHKLIEECIGKIGQLNKPMMDLVASLEKTNISKSKLKDDYDKLKSANMDKLSKLYQMRGSLIHLIDYLEGKSDDSDDEEEEIKEQPKQKQKAQSQKPQKQATFQKAQSKSTNTEEDVKAKNESFLGDVLCLLNKFATELESMLRDHLELPKEEKPKQESPVRDDSDSIDDDPIDSLTDSDDN